MRFKHLPVLAVFAVVIAPLLFCRSVCGQDPIRVDPGFRRIQQQLPNYDYFAAAKAALLKAFEKEDPEQLDTPHRFQEDLSLAASDHIQGMAVLDDGTIVVNYSAQGLDDWIERTINDAEGARAGFRDTYRPDLLFLKDGQWHKHTYDSPEGHCSNIQAAGHYLAVGHDYKCTKFFDCADITNVKELKHLEIAIDGGGGQVGFAFHPYFRRYVVYDAQNSHEPGKYSANVWISNHDRLQDPSCRFQMIDRWGDRQEDKFYGNGQGGQPLLYIAEPTGPGFFLNLSLNKGGSYGMQVKELRIEDSHRDPRGQFKVTQKEENEDLNKMFIAKYEGWGDGGCVSFKWAGTATVTPPEKIAKGSPAVITLWAAPKRLDAA